MPPIARDLELRGIPENISIEGDTFTAPPGVEVRGRAGQVRSDGSLPGPTIGGLKTGVRPNPGLQYPQNQFYDFLRSKITSASTKVLASPTLIISENPEPIRGGQETSAAGDSAFSNAAIGRPFANESFITVGTQVITDYAVQAGQNGAANTCQPSFGTSGLTFGARVSKIDDNGYVTFSLSPAVSASTRQQNIQGCGLVDILSIRRLDTGTVRVRDGQTLILTGVIQDADAQVVSKWPVLGDLPLIGQFFRFSAGSRSKNELVIMVTPRIVDDSRQGLYGYGYRPELEAARGIVGGSL
jgi:type IV pilus assembly protein PilQ